MLFIVVGQHKDGEITLEGREGVPTVWEYFMVRWGAGNKTV